MGPVEETAKALGHELYDHRRRRPAGQVVVICGRNQALRSTLLSLPWKVPVKVPLQMPNLRCAFQMDASLCYK